MMVCFNVKLENELKKRQKEKKTVFALRLFIYYILSADLSGM